MAHPDCNDPCCPCRAEDDPSPQTVSTLDALLREIDDAEVSEGRPPLSVLVRHANGRVGKAFWDTVEKFNLRLEGESDDQVVARLEQEVFNLHGVRPA